MSVPARKRVDLKWSLAPFAATVVAFFALFGGASTPTLFFCVLKCAPVFSLMLSIALRGRSRDAGGGGALSRRILVGLAFSVLGDALLAFNRFAPGVVAFAVAQVVYTAAFGFRPLRPGIGVVCALVALAMFLFVRPGLSGSLQFLVPVYTLLVSAMVWRASARVRPVDFDRKTGRLWGCVGAIFFWISDGIIAANKFVRPIPYYHTLEMATYYAGQLGISLATLDSSD